MNNFLEQDVSLEKCPALVLNADYRPLSYYPLSLWSWQDTVKSVFLDRVILVSNYDRVVRSPSFNMQLPSVIALKDYIVPQSKPSFTRFNVFLRDKFSCQYCGSGEELHLIIYYQDLKVEKLIGIMLLQLVQLVMLKKGGKLLKFSGMKLKSISLSTINRRFTS
jgi:5-methylcytosine-specific restriction endonuclease McrA